LSVPSAKHNGRYRQLSATSNASSRKSQPDANGRASRVDNHDGIQNRRKPTIQLDEEQAIAVREPDAVVQLAPQHAQLMSERRVLSFKSGLRLEWRGQNAQDEAEQRDHCALTLGDSFS
jgi:hypothetical protein